MFEVVYSTLYNQIFPMKQAKQLLSGEKMVADAECKGEPHVIIPLHIHATEHQRPLAKACVSAIFSPHNIP